MPVGALEERDSFFQSKTDEICQQWTCDAINTMNIHSTIITRQNPQTILQLHNSQLSNFHISPRTENGDDCSVPFVDGEYAVRGW